MTGRKSDNTETHFVLTEGTTVHQYRIAGKIGAGGMGEVYLAQDTKLQRRVALKFLPANLVSNEEVRTRFVREAQTIARLNHPNIVSVYEVGDYHGRPFYAMELVEGQSLKHFAHDETLPVDTLVEYAIQICQGLAEAHRAGITHRDIKAANIAVDRQERIRLLDFGLATVQGGEKLTKSGSTLGTVAYMSPEQVSGRKVDHRSDLFSLGVVLYELIAGRTPFERANDGATLKAIVEATPEPLSRYKADVPEKLGEIIFKLLEKDVEIRYQSAEGVIADLKRLFYDSKGSSGSGRVVRRSGRGRTAVYAAAVVAVLAAAAGYLYFTREAADAGSEPPVLAVLPFANLGSDADSYFAEGITAEIRSRLTTLEGVRVISGNSVERYRGTTLSADQIGRELGADYLLEGTIRWDKSSEIEKFRITTELTQTRNNIQVWSKSYDRDLRQIFAVQAAIADQISGQLGVALSATRKVADASYPTENLEAYNYYLKGLDLVRRSVFFSTKLNGREPIVMFDSAIALDPNFALAWAQKSKACTELSFGGGLENFPYRDTALHSAERALELNPNLPEAHIALGTYHNFLGTDYDRALAEFAVAHSEIHANADLSQAIGIVKMRQGKWDEAVEEFEEAARLDPLNTTRYYWLANLFAQLRDFKKADQYVNRSFALAPGNADAVFMKLFISLLEHGDLEAGEYKLADLTAVATLAEVASWDTTPSNTFGLWRFLPEKYRTREVIDALRGDHGPDNRAIYCTNVAEVFRLMDQPDSARIYLDSATIPLNAEIEAEPEDPHAYARLGLVMARLGNAEEAERNAKRAYELMPVDVCHW